MSKHRLLKFLTKYIESDHPLKAFIALDIAEQRQPYVFIQNILDHGSRSYKPHWLTDHTKCLTFLDQHSTIIDFQIADMTRRGVYNWTERPREKACAVYDELVQQIYVDILDHFIDPPSK